MFIFKIFIQTKAFLYLKDDMDIKLNEIPRASQTQQSGHRRQTSERKEPKGIEFIHLNEEKTCISD